MVIVDSAEQGLVAQKIEEFGFKCFQLGHLIKSEESLIFPKEWQ